MIQSKSLFKNEYDKYDLGSLTPKSYIKIKNYIGLLFPTRIILKKVDNINNIELSKRNLLIENQVKKRLLLEVFSKKNHIVAISGKKLKKNIMTILGKKISPKKINNIDIKDNEFIIFFSSDLKDDSILYLIKNNEIHGFMGE